MELIEKLMSFGLTRQESLIFVELTKSGSLTGYEVAKNTGISRSNTYTALAGLVDKGAAYHIEGSAAKYKAVNVSEFCDNKINYLGRLKTEIEDMMPEETEDAEGYITIKGRNHILDKIRNLLHSVQERVYIYLDYDNLMLFKEDIENLAEKNMKIVIITDKKTDFQNVKSYVARKKRLGQIRLITDSKNVLTGEVTDEYSTCLFSDKKNLVDVFKEALGNEIKLIQLVEGEKK